MDIQQIHSDLLADLSTLTTHQAWTSFPWITLQNPIVTFPRFFVEPPGVIENETDDNIFLERLLDWNIYYINKYENVVGTNPFVDVMGIIETVYNHYTSSYTGRLWTTAEELLYTKLSVMNDNQINSWARDLKQPYAAVQFVLEAKFLCR
jgi:hypothetical protein